ncbi:DUF2141 domain-containing protein [Calothrix sp. PCC 6303]|uniref:DUF2141 domain-containing protein n=1 Tax=Calothrix sp. PCC 6303 TaxID=1170562 RepID=UPI0002A02303|nr:DUF2141 domain-containing protein [Calothrix sp. PCC 6303]AFZ00758.1 Protein of unknown function DUF2141 [Calothrix sp. PCC 6303]
MRFNLLPLLCLTFATTNAFYNPVLAQSTSNMTVVVNGIKSESGRVCFRVYSSDQGFPFSNKSEVQSGCVEKTGSVVKKQFVGLKPGNYAVTVIDDSNRDGKLNTDFLGIPQEGFGVSNNPTVSITTGTPKFSKASFSLNKNTVINIRMKYSLD